MARFMSVLLGLTLFMALAAGCSPTRTVVVLMPDPDGHVGKAEVHNANGRELLEASRQKTVVSSRWAAPAPATTASAEFIAATFAEVMAIEPPPADKFILYFHTSTTELVPASQATFAAILDSVRRRGAVTVSISGHTDSSGSVRQNEILARDRANAIRDLLIQKGVDAGRLTVSSHGQGNQLVPTADGVAQPQNRRVEVIVR